RNIASSPHQLFWRSFSRAIDLRNSHEVQLETPVNRERSLSSQGSAAPTRSYAAASGITTTSVGGSSSFFSLTDHPKRSTRLESTAWRRARRRQAPGN